MGIYDESVRPHKDHNLTDIWVQFWIMYVWTLKWDVDQICNTQSDFYAADIIEHNGNQSWLCVWAYVVAQTCPKNRSMLYGEVY